MGSCFGKETDKTSDLSFQRTDVDYGQEKRKFSKSNSAIDKLVLETLSVLKYSFTNPEEIPLSFQMLKLIAEKERGWLKVIYSIVNIIPISNPFGPAVILLLLESCPLPTKELLLKLITVLEIGANNLSAKNNCNICIVLSVLAEILAGPNSEALLTESVLQYLMDCLEKEDVVILFALIALQKFGQTSQNKERIKKKLNSMPQNPLLYFESWLDDDDCVKKQIGFSAQWCLDNTFISPLRPYTYLNLNRDGINAILNYDCSELVKISPDGLIARVDANSFESVRCTYRITKGSWYYECELVTEGVMQIGWGEKVFIRTEGCGCGDYENSIGYDGCRGLLWNAGVKSKAKCWKSGDILGCYLNIDDHKAIFYLNGDKVASCHTFGTVNDGIYATASFMSFQQCIFNFGHKPFKYPPKHLKFKTFNDEGHLKEDEKIIYPKHILVNLSMNESIDGSCVLCYGDGPIVKLSECSHDGFCINCAKKLSKCPYCRKPVTSEDIYATYSM